MQALPLRLAQARAPLHSCRAWKSSDPIVRSDRLTGRGPEASSAGEASVFAFERSYYDADGDVLYLAQGASNVAATLLGELVQ